MKSEDNLRISVTKHSTEVSYYCFSLRYEIEFKSEDYVAFNTLNFYKILKNFEKKLKIYLRSEPYLPVGNYIWTFVKGCREKLIASYIVKMHSVIIMIIVLACEIWIYNFFSILEYPRKLQSAEDKKYCPSHANWLSFTFAQITIQCQCQSTLRPWVKKLDKSADTYSIKKRWSQMKATL